MIAAVADTHILIWYLAGSPRLSTTAIDFMQAAARRGESIGLSSITFVELVYLIEKAKFPRKP
jgi:PIN domain nuclease of toxin-antitoxin system